MNALRRVIASFLFLFALIFLVIGCAFGWLANEIPGDD
jgi:hypothetical protein